MTTRYIVLAAAAALAAGCAGVDPAQERAAALEYWTVKTIPPVHQVIAHPRIALVEFSLQYAPPEPRVDIANSARLEIPELMYAVFASVAKELGREICPLDEVRAAVLERNVPGVRFEEIRMTASPAAEAARWVPVDGLRVLPDNDPAAEAAVLKVVEDTGADFALQARLKVTLRNGRAVILPGSTLRATSAHGPTLLETAKSFESTTTLPAGGTIRSAEFAELLLEVARPFARTAMLAAGRND